ncbi:MAG: ABC-ATPase UvrA [Paenibacillus sp.]|nr:ABC-ATPase UvrA [Paenibacillus sp.]
MEPEYIVVEGANTHNLKNVNLRIPRGKLVVITGVSGSGKSSLAFDTIYAEGQRRYMESLSSYAKQVVGQMEKPDVLFIDGLSPAISIDQKTIGRNPRSTVGSITEIADYLRLLYAAIGSNEGEPLLPREFSPNSPYGACPACAGIGSKTDIDPTKMIARDRSLKQGAILLWVGTSGWEVPMIKALAQLVGIDYNLPLVEQDERFIDILLYGYNKAPITYTHRGEERSHYFKGVVSILGNMRDQGTTSKGILSAIEQFSGQIPCPECKGKKLKKESLAIRILGKTIADVMTMSVSELKLIYQGLTSALSGRDQAIARHVQGEIVSRLSFLENVGLGYLTLGRTANTLSGGEAQRIRLASQIGSKLCGVLYVLDEPSIGLHPRDNTQLIATLQRLRDNGNTVLVVEHDEETMRAADWIVDLGPGAGPHGGEVIAEGTNEDITRNDRSLTGAYLSGRKQIIVPTVRRKIGDKWLVIRGAREHNLKNVDVYIPISVFTCVTGVSGSGKSSLVNDILYRLLSVKLSQSTELPGLHDSIEGIQHVKKVISIDQSPIGRTPTSNPATYTGAYELIRDLLADTSDAKRIGYTKSHFSFNVSGKNAGRCEACKGDGFVKIEMHFMPDVYVPCEECGGARFKKETLHITYNGKHIADFLNMTAGEAADFFANVPKLNTILKTLVEVGLDYLKLGQPASELSGGESQRVKLATELSRPSNGKTLYILDEPTTGLHAADTERLLVILQRFVENGNTVVVIEHNLDVMKSADYIIDMGPEGGVKGGYIVCCGTPEEIAACAASHTGRYLRSVIEKEVV